MATVRITQGIRDEASHRATRMFTKRLETAKVFWMDQTSLANRLIAVQLETQGLNDIFAKMPRQWKSATEGIYVEEVNGFKPKHQPRLSVDPAAIIPPVQPYQHYKIRVSSPSLLDVADQWEAWERNITTLQAERDAFLKMVNTFFSRHTTLRQAIEEWPGCLELVSSDVRERHEAKTERTVSEAAPIDQSTLDNLNRHVVTAKILGEK